jgi:hypothetical protein
VLKLWQKRVACFCDPKPCHLHVIRDFLVWVKKPEGQAWLRKVCKHLPPDHGLWSYEDIAYRPMRLDFGTRCPVCHAAIHIERNRETEAKVLVCDRSTCDWRWEL